MESEAAGAMPNIRHRTVPVSQLFIVIAMCRSACYFVTHSRKATMVSGADCRLTTAEVERARWRGCIFRAASEVL